MKKAIKILLALLLASAMVLVVAACTPEPTPPTPPTPSQDACEQNGHSWEITSTIQPTCGTDGKVVYTCSVCKTTQERSIPALGSHSWDDGQVTKQPTCSEDGERTFTCTNDGCTETYTEPIPATGVHTKGDHVPEVAATCQTEGHREYWLCQTCSAKLDASGAVIYSESSLVIAKLAHTYDDGTRTEPTCEAPGSIVYTCTTCDPALGPVATITKTIPQKGHNYGRLVAEEPAGCLSTGFAAHYYCEDCHKYFTADRTETSFENLVINATGHNPQKVEGKAPTCEEDGFQAYYVCQNCHLLFAEQDCQVSIAAPKVLRATGHNVVQIPEESPDCTHSGKSEGTRCSTCGKVFTAPKTLAPLGHDWGDWQYTNPADRETCTESGVQHRFCKRCTVMDTQTNTVPALGHNWDEWYTVQDATCLQDGIQHRDCARCGETDAEVNYLPKLNHLWGDWRYLRDDDKPTCTKDGVLRRTCQRDDCGTIDTQTQSVPALGHKYTFDKFNWSNSNTQANAVFLCGNERCPEPKKEVAADVVVDEQTDYTNYKATATFQGQTYTATKTVEHNHDHEYFVPDGGWNWSDDFSSAKVTFDCSVCTGDPHTLDAAVKKDVQPATCTEDGLETYTATASYGGVSATDVKTKALPATGHTKDESQHTEYKAATCTEPGNVEYWICKGCGKKLDKDDNVIEEEKITIAALGHEFKQLVEAQDPTCTEPGHKAYWQCERCHLYFAENDKQTPVDYEKDLETAATGHTSDKQLHTDEQKRTHYYECTVCQAHLEETACNVPETYHHSTEQHWHECTVCNHQYDVVAHGEFTYESLKDQPGQHKVFCGVCKEFIENEACTPDAGDSSLTEGWHATEDDHWQVCSKCKQEYGRASHDFTNGTACNTCGKEVSAVLVEFGIGEQKTTHGVASVEAAFEYISEQGAQGPFIVTLKQNCTETDLIAPEGVAVWIHVGTFTFELQNLTIKANSNLYVVVGDQEGKEGTFTCQEIYYNDVNCILKLPAGDYTFHFADGITCDKATILVCGENIQHQWTYSDCSWPTEYNGEEQLDVTFNLSCSVCSAKHSEQAKATKDAEQSQAAGCTENGKAVFHASVEYSGKQLTADKEYTINALGHKYDGKKYKTDNWQHDRVCDNCSQPEGKPVACTPENNTCKDCGHTYSVDEILTRFQKESDLPGTYRLTGTITKVDSADVYFTVGGDSVTMNIQCYKINLNGVVSSTDDLFVGAIITVSGELTTYTKNGTKEFASGCKLEEYIIPTHNITVTKAEGWSDDIAMVSTDENAKYHSEVKINVTLKDNKHGVLVTIKDTKGNIVPALSVEGGYTFTMPNDDVTIVVEIRNAKITSVVIDNPQNNTMKFSSAYADEATGKTHVFNGVTIKTVYVIGNKTTPFQGKTDKEKGVYSYIFNTTPFPGSVTCIVINLTDSTTQGEFKVTWGTEYDFVATNEHTRTHEKNDTNPIVIDISEEEHITYFKIDFTGGAAYIENIMVNCEECLHTQLTKVEEKSPTCTENGYATYWKCDLCNKLFSDEDCQTEIKEPQTAGFEYTGHKWKVDESVNGDGWTWTDKQATLTLECETCHQKLVLDAVISSEAPTAPKCDTDGYTVYNAKVTKPENGAHGEVTVTEKDIFDREDYSSTKNLDPTPKLEHKQNGQYAVKTWAHYGDNQHKGQCTLCKEEIIENCGDINTFEVKSGDGKHWRECPTCHYHYEESSHSFKDGVCTYPGCDAKAENVGVIIGGEETKYQTLADALQHVTGGVTAIVKLYNDSSEATLNIPNSGDVTLDLNSYTLTVTSEIVVTGGTLTITGGTLNASVKVTGGTALTLTSFTLNGVVTYADATANAKLDIQASVDGEYTFSLDGVQCTAFSQNHNVTIKGVQLVDHNYSYTKTDETNHHVECGYCNYQADESHDLYCVAESGTDTTHHVKCEKCEYEDDLDHDYGDGTWQPAVDDQHSRTCQFAGCGHKQTENHNWDKATVSFDESKEDHQTKHTLTCECGETKQVDHTLNYQYVDDHDHHVSCGDGCGYNEDLPHSFKDAEGNPAGCACGEPLCKEENGTITLTGTRGKGGNLFSDKSTTGYYTSTAPVDVGGVNFSYEDVGTYTYTDDVIQMRKTKPSVIKMASPINGRITQIVITLRYSSSGAQGSTILKDTLDTIIKVTFGKVGADGQPKWESTDVEAKMSKTQLTFTWNAADTDDYTYVKFEHAHYDGKAVYVESIAISYELHAGHHVVDSWTDGSKASCWEDGTKTGTCIRCGKEVTQVVEVKSGHNWQLNERVDATCENPAIEEQYHCDKCGRYAKNEGVVPDKYAAGSETPYYVEGSEPRDHDFSAWESNIDTSGKHQHRQVCVYCQQPEGDGAWVDCAINFMDYDQSGHWPDCPDCHWNAEGKTGYSMHTFEEGSCTGCDAVENPVQVQIEDGEVSNVQSLEAAFQQAAKAGSGKTVTITVGTGLTSGSDITYEGEANIVLILQSEYTANLTISSSASVTIKGSLNGNLTVKSGIVILQNATINNLTLEVKDGNVNFSDAASTIRGEISIWVSDYSASSLYLVATFEKNQAEYNDIHVTTGDDAFIKVHCNDLSQIKFNNKPISHTYSEYLEIEGDDTYHKATCVICGSVNDKLEHGEPNAENKCPDCGHQFKAKEKVYKKITSMDDLVHNGQYLIVCENKNVIFDGSLSKLDASSNNYSVVIENNQIKSSDDIDKRSFCITQNSDSYFIKAANGKYIGLESSSTKNGLTPKDNGIANKITFDDSGELCIAGGKGNALWLRYNATSGQNRFRFFKQTTVTGDTKNYLAIQLYLLQ